MFALSTEPCMEVFRELGGKSTASLTGTEWGVDTAASFHRYSTTFGLKGCEEKG